MLPVGNLHFCFWEISPTCLPGLNRVLTMSRVPKGESRRTSLGHSCESAQPYMRVLSFCICRDMNFRFGRFMYVPVYVGVHLRLSHRRTTLKSNPSFSELAGFRPYRCLADSFFLMSSRSGILISSPSSGPKKSLLSGESFGHLCCVQARGCKESPDGLADPPMPTPGPLTELHRAQDHGLPARKEAEPKPASSSELARF